MAFFPSRTVALEVLGFSIHWYGVMYLLAFLFGLWILPRLQKHRDVHLTSDDWSTVLMWAIFGVIIGGRLGFVFFYEPVYFWGSPSKILAVWEGGMSSHGGFIGVALALGWVLKKRWGGILKVADLVVIPVAIGFALGRFGNFINQELYGTVTDLSWGWNVPEVGELRHPWPVYAMISNVVIAGVCFWYLRLTSYLRAGHGPAGRVLALFLTLYGLSRFFLEYLRAQEYPFIDTGVLLLTRGQFLTLGILLVGLWLFYKTSCGEKKTDHIS